MIKYPITRETKIHKIGGSLMIVLPAMFVEIHCIKEGDSIGLSINDGVITIVPTLPKTEPSPEISP